MNDSSNLNLMTSSDAPKRLSYSALGRFRRCPWIFYLADVCGQPAPGASRQARLGGLIHKVIENYHRSPQLFPMSLEAMLEAYNALWPNFMPDYLFSRPGEALETQARGQLMLENFHRQDQTEKHEYRLVSAEMGFNYPLSKDITLTGRIDRIDSDVAGNLRILDYKTSQQSPENHPNPEDSIQLGVYAMAVARTLNEPITQIGFYYLSHQIIQTGQYSEALAEKTHHAFSELLNAIQTQTFLPEPEAEKCPTCEYRARCPVFQ